MGWWVVCNHNLPNYGVLVPCHILAPAGWWLATHRSQSHTDKEPTPTVSGGKALRQWQPAHDTKEWCIHTYARISPRGIHPSSSSNEPQSISNIIIIIIIAVLDPLIRLSLAGIHIHPLYVEALASRLRMICTEIDKDRQWQAILREAHTTVRRAVIVTSPANQHARFFVAVLSSLAWSSWKRMGYGIALPCCLAVHRTVCTDSVLRSSIDLVCEFFFFLSWIYVYYGK